MSVRLLLDENLSERLVPLLAPEFTDVEHVRRLGMGGATDDRIWHFASEQRCLLVTRDEDFVRLAMSRGAPPKVVRLDSKNAPNPDIAAMLRRNAERIRAFADDPELAFLVLAVRAR